MVGFRYVHDYLRWMRAVNANKRRTFLSTVGWRRFHQCYAVLSDDDTVGVIVTPEGDIANLFNNSDRKGAAIDALHIAIGLGGRTLDCFDGFLPEYYARQGFEPVVAMSFEDDLAPDGWNFERDGRPDVIHMAYTGRPQEYRHPGRYTANWNVAKRQARLVAYRHHVRTEATVNGKPVTIGINAYIKP